MKNRRLKKRPVNNASRAKDVKFEAGRILKVFEAHVEDDKKNFDKIIQLISTANLNLELHIGDQDKRWVEMKPVIEAFNGAKWTGWAIGKVVGVISLIVGAIYGVQQIFKHSP